MTIFIWVIIVLFVIDVFGKSIMLAKQDYQRKEGAIIVDIFITLCMIVWAAYLLGSNT